MILNHNQMDIETTVGDTISFGFQMEGLGEDVDSAFFTVKENYTDEGPLLQVSLGDGIEKYEPEDPSEEGIYTVHISAERASVLPIGTFYYDLQVGLRGDVYTLMKGIMKVTYDVTRQ